MEYAACFHSHICPCRSCWETENQNLRTSYGPRSFPLHWDPPQCSPTGFTLHTTQDRGSVQRVKIRIFPIGLTFSAAGTIFDWPLALCPVSAPNNRFLQVTPLACPMIHQVRCLRGFLCGSPSLTDTVLNRLLLSSALPADCSRR